MISEQPQHDHPLNEQYLTTPILIQITKDQDDNNILAELRIDTVRMYEAIPYFVENRVLTGSGKSYKQEIEVHKVSEAIVRPFTLKVIEDVLRNTDSKIPQTAKISSDRAEDSIDAGVRKILSKFNPSELQRIYKSAAYFSMTNLKLNVAAMIGVKVFVGNKPNDFEQKQKQLKVKKAFNNQVMNELRKEMPELEVIL